MASTRAVSDHEPEAKPETWSPGGPGPAADAALPDESPAGQALADRLAAGRALRAKAARSAHADWKPPADRPDPVDVLEASNRNRLPDLVPIRYGRMVQSPFAFLRGPAALMAH